MTGNNVFFFPPSSTALPKKSSRRSLDDQEWCIITNDDRVRMAAVDMIIESCDAAFGPATIWHGTQDCEVIMVSHDMVERLKEKHRNRFIALHKENRSRPWAVDKSTARMGHFGRTDGGSSAKSTRK